MAIPSSRLPTWYRAFALVVGLISIVLSLLVLADPVLGVTLLIFLLGFALFVMGIDRVVTGITGHQTYWMSPFPPGMGGSPPGSPPGSTPPPKP